MEGKVAKEAFIEAAKASVHRAITGMPVGTRALQAGQETSLMAVAEAILRHVSDELHGMPAAPEAATPHPPSAYSGDFRDPNIPADTAAGEPQAP